VPASAFRGLLLPSWPVITNEGTQSEEPPLSGIAAVARILYRTGVIAGIEYEEIVPAENMPTRGLLAGYDGRC
jgi:hypothetical protein